MNRCMTYICDVCKNKLPPKELGQNVYCRVYSIEQYFTCVGCSNIISVAFEVTKRKQPTYACEECEKVYKTYTGWIIHSYEHSNDWPYHCEECGKGFAFKSLLTAHNKAIHSEERPFKCSICPSTFKLKQHLTRHLNWHDEQNPFTCEKCHLRCPSQHALDTHMLKHSDLKRFKCVICSSAYKHKHHLDRHMAKSHHKSTLKC